MEGIPSEKWNARSIETESEQLLLGSESFCLNAEPFEKSDHVNLWYGFGSFDHSQPALLSMVKFDRAASQSFVSPNCPGMRPSSKYEMVTAGGALLAYYAPLPCYQLLPVITVHV